MFEELTKEDWDFLICYGLLMLLMVVVVCP